MKHLRVFVVALVLLPASPSLAADRYALIVGGASGGREFAIRYDYWRTTIAGVLGARYGYPDAHVIQLADREQGAVRTATRENVRAALADLARRVMKDDVVLILLIGHGTATDADDAKFNLVGPDLTAAEWAGLVRPIAGRLVFINASSGSYPFLQKLSARGRVVITATDAVSQQSDPLFTEFFFGALLAAETDSDKNGKVSVWEAFAHVSRQIRDWFEQQGQFPSERPLLDDTGAGIGREAQLPGPDGPLAQVTYLDAERPVVGTDPRSAALVKRRAEIETEMDRLRARRAQIAAELFDAELEKLLLELAQIDRELRSTNP